MFWFVNCSHAFFTAPFLLSPNFIKSPANKDPRQGRKQFIAKKAKRKEKKGQRCDWLINPALYFFGQSEVEAKCDFGHMTFPAFFGRYTIG